MAIKTNNYITVKEVIKLRNEAEGLIQDVLNGLIDRTGLPVSCVDVVIRKEGNVGGSTTYITGPVHIELDI